MVMMYMASLLLSVFLSREKNGYIRRAYENQNNSAV